VITHVVPAAVTVTSAAAKRPTNDRGRRRRRVSHQVLAPLTTCSIAVATSSTADRITGRRLRRRHWSGQAPTADAATRYHATCSTSPEGGELATRTDWKTGSTVCCHSQQDLHRPASELSRRVRYAANRPPAAHSFTSSTLNSHGLHCLRRDAVHSAAYAVLRVCASVCPSRSCTVVKRVNIL